jgi:hypothetical protein
MASSLVDMPRTPPGKRPFAFRRVGCALAYPHGALFEPANVVSDAVEQVHPGRSALLDLLRSLFRAPRSRNLLRFPGEPLAVILWIAICSGSARCRG